MSEKFNLTQELREVRKVARNTCGNNSVVECHLAKVDVEGSNPFSRSRISSC